MTFSLKWAKAKFPALKDADEKLAAKRAELKAVFDEAGPELDPKRVKSVQVADGTDLHEIIKALNDELEDLKAEVDKHQDTARAAYNALHGADRGEPGHLEGEGRASLATPRTSVGEAFVASQAYQGYQGGGVGPVAHLDIDVATLMRPQASLFETGDGWEPESTRTGIVTLIPERMAPFVVDYITSIPTTQAAVKYMEETTYTNTSQETAEGGAFPEAALKLTERSVTVQKIPIWLPMTDEQLEDQAGAQAYVESRLLLMLRQRIDLQALRGDGTAPNLLGTESVTGIQTQAKGADPIPDAILKLFTLIRDDNDAGGGDAEPNVVFVRATKWETVQLLRTADGIYIWGHPSTPGPRTIWGVPVALTNAVTATKAVSGDYRTHAFVAPRRGVDVQVTNAHNDFFTSGKQAVRMDVRLAVVHLRPSAFGEVTGL
jgi:HK97 family phage major capsid protein